MYHENNDITNEPSMNVSGTGVSKTMPDRFSISFEIRFEDAEDKYVYHHLTQESARLLQALNSWAKETDNVESSSFSLDHYTYDRKAGKWKYGQTISVGYFTVYVTSSRLDEASEVTRIGKENGATEINYVNYYLSPELKLKESQQALENAVAKAKSDAEITAKAFGIRLNGLLHVDINNYAENVSYDDLNDELCLDTINHDFHEIREKTPEFLKAGYVETRASVNAVYAIGNL